MVTIDEAMCSKTSADKGNKFDTAVCADTSSDLCGFLNIIIRRRLLRWLLHNRQSHFRQTNQAELSR